MPFNYATGAYEPDTPAPVQDQPNINDWMRLAGFGQGANPNLDYASQSQPNPNAPGTNPAGPTGVPPAPTVVGYPGHNGDPTVTTPYPVGTVITGTNKPGGVDFSSPTVVPDLMAQQQQSPLQIFSQNNGMNPNNPTLKGDFWSGTAGRWVDPTYGTDATGRVLSDAEKTYWQGYDHARASGTLDSYLKNVTNPGLAAGTQATYAPGVATTTIPGRTLDQTGAPGATAPAAVAQPGAPGATAAAGPQANPLDPAWDYSKPGAVPWQAFVKNLFADANAQQSYKELQVPAGQQGLTPEQVNQAAQLYGWQPMQGSASADANTVYRQAIQVAQADPTSDYSIVKMLGQDGTLQYGVMKRSQSTATQEAGGFYAPGSTNPNSPANKARVAAAQAAIARSRAVSSGGGARATGGSVVGGGGGPVYTKDQLLAAESRLGASQTAAYNARVNQTYNPVSTSPVPTSPATGGGADGQLPPGQTNAPYVPNPGTGSPGVPLYPGGNLYTNDGAGSVTTGAPGGTAPAPYGNPPEGAVRVNPDDSRSVWHNGRWVPGNYQPGGGF